MDFKAKRYLYRVGGCDLTLNYMDIFADYEESKLLAQQLNDFNTYLKTNPTI
jgi:hypothetical protein